MLYEVITHRLHHGVQFDDERAGVRASVSESITPEFRNASSRRRCVITSYSIHYTKLYEAGLAWAGVATVAAILVPMAGAAVGVAMIMPTAMAASIGPFPRIAGAASSLAGFVHRITSYNVCYTKLLRSSFVLIDVLGLAPTNFGYAFACVVAGLALGSILAGRLARSLRPHEIAGIGVAAMTAATLAMAGLAWAGRNNFV